MDEAERVRRDFAAAWGAIGAAWGVAPSTAAVQGYLLVSGGPLTESELRAALGLSHRAAFGALAGCEAWGLIEPAPPKRSGARGPAGRAWVAVPNHWEWFRRVAEARKRRETDPVLPLLAQCLRRARAAQADELAERIGRLLAFTHQFDAGVSAVVASDSAVLEQLFGVLVQVPPEKLESLLATLAAVPQPELVAAAERLAGMRPATLRRLVHLAAQPGVARLLSWRIAPAGDRRRRHS